VLVAPTCPGPAPEWWVLRIALVESERRNCSPKPLDYSINGRDLGVDGCLAAPKGFCPCAMTSPLPSGVVGISQPRPAEIHLSIHGRLALLEDLVRGTFQLPAFPRRCVSCTVTICSETPGSFHLSISRFCSSELTTFPQQPRC